MAAAMWDNLGRTFAESFRLSALVASGRIAFAPDERFDEVARGAPFIVCGLHLGNWEILAHGGKRMGLPIAGVYQRMSNPFVEARMRRMRAPLYLGGLLPKTAITARALFRAIKAGACPSFLADLRDDRGPLVPSSACRRTPTSFRRCSPARPGSPSTPASRSASRTSISAFASSRSSCRRQRTGTPTRSSPPRRCSASSRPSFARRRSNGCGRTGSGISRLRTGSPARIARPGSSKTRSSVIYIACVSRARPKPERARKLGGQ